LAGHSSMLSAPPEEHADATPHGSRLPSDVLAAEEVAPLPE